MSGIWRGILTGIPRTSPDVDNVVPLREPPSVEAMLTELRAYDAQLMDRSIGIERADREYVQERNRAAADYNALLKRALSARTALAEHLKTYGMRIEFPHTPGTMEIVTARAPSEPLRQRQEPEHNHDD